MIRRRIAAVAFAAGCLLSQAGCTGFGFGSSTNNCPNTTSSCCLTSGGGIFSRMFGSPAPAAACCPPTCAPACAASPCSGSVMTSGYDSAIVGAPSGGAPGCGCNRDPFQFTGMQGGAPTPIMTTMPGPISQGAPINIGPDMTQPYPSTPYIPGPPPAPNQGPPRMVPVPQMPQSPVPAGAYSPGNYQQWTPGH